MARCSVHQALLDAIPRLGSNLQEARQWSIRVRAAAPPPLEWCPLDDIPPLSQSFQPAKANRFPPLEPLAGWAWGDM
jgi:hypothetical protein